MGKKTKVYFIEQPYPVAVPQQKQYGCLSFCGDLFMVLITGGLWLIWIFIREMRRQ